MQKENLTIGQKVYHTNLKEHFIVTVLDTGDPTTAVVQSVSDPSDEKEITVALLV